MSSDRPPGSAAPGPVAEIVYDAIIGYTGARTLGASQNRATRATEAVLDALEKRNYEVRYVGPGDEPQ